MSPATWNQEKPSGSRSRIVELLLKGEKTVDELAGTLDVTANAVRAQIALLEREGIVEVRGEAKRKRRPAAIYGVRAGADVHFSRAYPVVLSQLVKTLAGSLTQKQFETVMRNTGQGIADTIPRPTGDARARAAAAVQFLASLGSRAEASEKGGKIVILGRGCPISRAVDADVRFCAVMESILARLTGLPVTERCEHGARPGCRFEIRLSPGK